MPTEKALKYSVNLMWINSKLDLSRKYIYKADDEAEEKFFNPIFNWGSANQGSSINIWYDREFTSPDAIRNTKEYLDKRITSSKSQGENVLIELKDIRDFKEIKEHAEIFSDKTPVYFRVDLARVIIAVNELTHGNTSNFVYTDLDIEKTLSKEELFDEETEQNLEKYGIVMALGTSGIAKFENSFQIIRDNKDNLIEALNWILIELNIKRAENSLVGKYQNRPGYKNPPAETVFNTYMTMFMYFYHLENLGILSVSNKFLRQTELEKELEPYDKKKHGFGCFGEHGVKYPNDFGPTGGYFFKSKSDLIVVDNEGFPQKVTVPTKKVSLSFITGNYEEPIGHRIQLQKPTKRLLA